jgi:predicted outer membrane repeat protein
LGSGGAIYAINGSELTFAGETSFANNISGDLGGAIAAESTIITYLDNVSFEENKAVNGTGGATSSESSALTFTGSNVTYINNKSGQAGGAIYADGSSILTYSGEVRFASNTASQNGGAIYADGAVLTFLGDAVFENNTATTGQGGAIYANDSYIYISAGIKDITFAGNTASGQPNDIHLEGTSEIALDAAGNNIYVTGGLTGTNNSNIVTKSGTGDLTFSAGSTLEYYGTMTLEAGKTKLLTSQTTIGELNVLTNAGYTSKNDTANQITKVGSAIINGSIEFDVDITNETADMLQAYKELDGITGYTGKVLIGSASKLFLNMKGSPSTFWEIRIPIITAEDTNFQDMYTKGYSFGFSNVSDDTSDVNHPFRPMTVDKNLGEYNEKEYILEYSDNDVAIKKLAEIFPDEKGFLAIRLTHNQTEVMRSLHNIHIGQANGMGATADMLNTIENSLLPLASDMVLIDKILSLEGKKQVMLSYEEAPLLQALDELSGSIIANSLMMGAIDYGRASILERIRLNICEATEKTRQGIWAQGFGQGFNAEGDIESPGNFKSSAYGANLGADLLAGENWLAGIYAGYTNGEMKQIDSKGTINEMGIGIYGGYLGKHWEIKGKVFGGQQKYNIDRKLTLLKMETTGEFNASTIKGSADIGYKIGLSETLKLKPFIGAQAGYVKNEEFRESGKNYAPLLNVQSGDYTRLEAQGGLGLDYKKNKLNLYAKGYAGYLAMGSKPTFKGEFAGSGEKMEIWGIEQDEIGLGAGAGVEYEITKNWSIYANAAGAASGNTNGYYANLGITYRFGSNCEIIEMPIEEPIQEEEAPTIKEYRLLFNFATDKYHLSQSDKERIRKIAEEIAELAYSRVIVEGHTDNTGSFEHNKELSLKRAKSVRDEFIKQGIDKDKIEHKGFSYTKPIDTNKTAAGKAANRRTEVIVK